MAGRGVSGVLRFGLPGLILGLALASGGRGGGRELWAQGPVPGPSSVSLPVPPGSGAERSKGLHGGEADGTIAFTTNPGGPIQFLYLVDTKSQAFTIYRVDANQGNVKLVAARRYSWDLKLSEYNNTGLGPPAIEAMVNSAGASKTR